MNTEHGMVVVEPAHIPQVIMPVKQKGTVYWSKNCKTWWMSFKHKGKRFYFNTKEVTEPAARQYLNVMLKKLARGEWDPVQEKQNKQTTLLSTILDRYVKHLEDRKTTKGGVDTARWIVRRLKEFFGDTPLGQIRSRMDEYKYVFRRHISKVTLNREMCVLKSALYRAVENGLIDANPLQKYKLEKVSDLPSKRRRVITYDEYQKIVECIHPDLQPLLRLAKMTGARPGEMRSLRWEYIELKSATKNGKPVFLAIFDLPHTKTGPSRRTFGKDVFDLLSATPVGQRKGYVFKHTTKQSNHHIDGQKIGAGFLKYHWAKAIKKAGIPPCVPVDFRHTYITNGADLGMPEILMAQSVGHKGTRMLRGYYHPQDENLAGWNDRLNERPA